MKRVISAFITAVFIAAVFFVLPASAAGENLVSEENSSVFKNPSLWSEPYGGYITRVKVENSGDTSNCCLGFFRERFYSWESPCIDLYPVIGKDIRESGKGKDYVISFDVFFAGLAPGEKTLLNALFRCTNEVSASIIQNSESTEFRFAVTRYEIKTGLWYHIEAPVRFEYTDVSGEQTWNFCFDSLDETVKAIYIDNFSVVEGFDVGSIQNGYSGQTNAGVAGETAAPSYVISQPTATPTATPIRNVIQSPIATAQPGENLLSEDESEFEDSLITWIPFGGAVCEIGEGYSGNGLKMTSVPHSWSSPALDIAPYITSPGVYSVGLAVKVKGESEMSSVNLLIRGTRENSFLHASGNNVLTSLSSARGKTNEWFFVTGSFTVTEEDIKNKDQWLLCLGSISEGTKSLTIDKVQLVFGKASNIERIETEAGAGIFIKNVEFDRGIANAFYVSVAISLFAVTAVIAFKIKKEKE